VKWVADRREAFLSDAQFAGPLPYGFVADDDAARGQQLVHHAKTEREAEIQPNRITDDLGREPISGIAGSSGCRHSICGRPLPGKGKRWVAVARGRMLSSVRPLMRQEDSRRPVWEFADRVQITHRVLEAQWKPLVVPAPSRRLLRHTLLPLTLTCSRPWSAYAAAAGVL